MTLQEVMNQIPQKKWSTRVPSVALMLEQDSPIFYDALDGETNAAIYSSGFVCISFIFLNSTAHYNETARLRGAASL